MESALLYEGVTGGVDDGGCKGVNVGRKCNLRDEGVVKMSLSGVHVRVRVCVHVCVYAERKEERSGGMVRGGKKGGREGGARHSSCLPDQCLIAAAMFPFPD